MLKNPRPILCGLPKRRPIERAVSIFGEGAACIWIWVWPHLLGWHSPIVWLFPSVLGNKTERGLAKAGDLWGVDATGELLILEAKSCYAGHRRVDPFADFVGPAKKLIDGTCTDVDADRLEDDWHKLLNKEREFIKEHLREFKLGKPLTGTYRGILPYSRKRAALQIWRDLYCNRVVPMVKGSKYPLTVRRYLDQRKGRGNPPPHFIGLLASVDGTRPALNRNGGENMTTLKNMAQGRVHAVVISGSVIGNKTKIVSEPVSQEALRK